MAESSLVVELAEVGEQAASEPFYGFQDLRSEPSGVVQAWIRDSGYLQFAGPVEPTGFSYSRNRIAPTSSTWLFGSEPVPRTAAVLQLLQTHRLSAIAQQYANLVKDFDWVKRVGLKHGSRGVITTLFDAPPFDSAFRKLLFAAELKALERVRPTVPPEFVLINQAEYRLADESWEPSLDDEPLFERS